MIYYISLNFTPRFLHAIWTEWFPSVNLKKPCLLYKNVPLFPAISISVNLGFGAFLLFLHKAANTIVVIRRVAQTVAKLMVMG